MVRITTLMENVPSEHKALKAEHGLSFLVEAGGKRFLFDCGSGEDTLYNAHRLGVDLTTVDFTVCSHSHYDHAAGFRDMVEQGAGGGLLYTGPGFWDKKYALTVSNTPIFPPGTTRHSWPPTALSSGSATGCCRWRRTAGWWEILPAAPLLKRSRPAL